MSQKDLTESFRYFRMTSNAGLLDAQLDFAECYHQCTGVKIALIDAVHCFRTAAEAGHVTAQFNEGVCYNESTGVTKDLHLKSELVIKPFHRWLHH